jgi:hypothetical protein
MQAMAQAERAIDDEAARVIFQEAADDDVREEEEDFEELMPRMTDAQIVKKRKKVESHRRRAFRAAKEASFINVFEEFLPKLKKTVKKKEKKGRKARKPADEEPAKPAGDEEDEQTMVDVEGQPPLIETPRFWFTCYAPRGGVRCGDVQLSFQLVRREEVKKDETMLAGKGRSEPQALEAPARASGFFWWMNNPLIAGYVMLWRNYKYYFLVAFCIVLSAVYVFLFISGGVGVKSQQFFK